MEDESQVNFRPKLPLESLFIIPNERVLETICGREHLNMVDEKGSKIGILKLSISILQEDGKCQFVIHSSGNIIDSTSEDSAKGSKFGMSLTSRVTTEYETLEEFRREYLIIEDSKCEKTLHFIKLKGKYRLTIKDNRLDKSESNTYSISPSGMRNFISEGANILLMKYIALNRKIGKLRTQTMLINGDICRSQLFVFPSGLTLLDETIDTITVVRTVKGQNGVVQKIYSWMDSNGRIMKQEWPNTGRSYRLEIDRDLYPKALYKPLHIDWEDDLQMRSVYMDRVENLSRFYRSYILDSPELKHILMDFILQVTLDKPDRIVEYAIEFFTSFGHNNNRNGSKQIKDNFKSNFGKEKIRKENGEKDFWSE